MTLASSPRTARLVPFALLVFAAAGCSHTIQMDSVTQSVTDGIAAQLGLQVDAVACPAGERDAKAGDEFECTVTPKEGGRLTVKVTQQDDQGSINWTVVRTEGLLDLAKVEASVQKGLKDQAQADATVSCGGRWKAAKQGDTFECQAKTAAGDAVAIAVTVTDNESNIEWSTK